MQNCAWPNVKFTYSSIALSAAGSMVLELHQHIDLHLRVVLNVLCAFCLDLVSYLNCIQEAGILYQSTFVVVFGLSKRKFLVHDSGIPIQVYTCFIASILWPQCKFIIWSHELPALYYVYKFWYQFRVVAVCFKANLSFSLKLCTFVRGMTLQQFLIFWNNFLHTRKEIHIEIWGAAVLACWRCYPESGSNSLISFPTCNICLCHSWPRCAGELTSWKL